MNLTQIGTVWRGIQRRRIYADGNNRSIGTAHSGYAGPEHGPFECRNCYHSHDEGSTCDHPDVVKDLKEQGLTEDGKAYVDAQGCCNYFRPLAHMEGK